MSNLQNINISGPLKGQIHVPGDKSMTHRAIILSALARGTSIISEPLLGEDCLRTVEIFRKLGVEITVKEDSIVVRSPGYQHLHIPHQVLYTGNSGTTTRLVAGLLCGLGINAVLSGDSSIGQRPMDRIIQPLRKMGAHIEGIEDNYTPLIIKPASIRGIQYKMEVASAQVKSAILLAGLFANGTTTIYESTTTRNHTETMFQHYQIPIKVSKYQISLEKRAIEHIQPSHFKVPGDISSAAYFIVAGLITPGSDITIHNVGLNPTRSGIIDVVKLMNGNIEQFNTTNGPEPTASIRVQYTPDLKPIHINGELIPRAIDEIPIIALLCTQASGISQISDAEELKYKETNRIDTTASELNKLGCQLIPTADGLLIKPSHIETMCEVDSHKDHRIGMMLAIASILSTKPIDIKQFEAVNISYPGFLTHLKKLEKEV
ncbi:3-phosphoshikimate 1-carboxyvinyltransferase [Staphylococcus sp. SQ8-PEA]|uniref:3-phosphoshikimate 1-carboxyvinyltransferase n=1 Tax=Staphylococcus marylandisciuri TaxID=2981529 RepID=A0ABT2QNC7_9STAP|nr:3-phosphoshikimate 1-carboxyvinyltransferase [Staphylococcus marylandisciuri]MCU5745486.1 3-phosphoshikimate 1-carboxyvinyltransferase [Staphylococcus marylandisciuri]